MSAFGKLLQRLNAFTAENAEVFYPHQLTWATTPSGSAVAGQWVETPGSIVTCWCDVWDPNTRNDPRSRAALQNLDFARDDWLGEVRADEPVPPVGATCVHAGATLEVAHVHEQDRATLGTPLVLRYRQ